MHYFMMPLYPHLTVLGIKRGEDLIKQEIHPNITLWQRGAWKKTKLSPKSNKGGKSR